jgi:hypothetical protein
VFPVRGPDLAGEGKDKAPVLLEFLGSCLGLEHSHRIAEVRKSAFPEFFDGWYLVWFYLRLRRHDFVEEFAFAVPATRFCVGLGYRDRSRGTFLRVLQLRRSSRQSAALPELLSIPQVKRAAFVVMPRSLAHRAGVAAGGSCPPQRRREPGGTGRAR